MSKKSTKTRTRFVDRVRIDPRQLLWIKDHKDTKTAAGFLDKIINFYKQHGHSDH